MGKNKITVKTVINTTSKKVWEIYNDPSHIKNWNNASDDWHTTDAKSDFRTGGKFDYRMEAKDKSAGFNFTGTYYEIVEEKIIKYTLDDNRKVIVEFQNLGDKTEVTVVFEAEETNSLDLQKQGWQSILDNFKKYIENLD